VLLSIFVFGRTVMAWRLLPVRRLWWKMVTAFSNADRAAVEFRRDFEPVT
jgi:hypothetical protein